MAKVDWDASSYEAAAPRTFEAIPKGRYLVAVDDTEMKETRNKNGEYLEVTFSVLAPKEHKGRKLWARLNVKNPSEVAQRIGREQFSALCLAAAGTTNITKTESLHNKKLVAHVSVRKNRETDELTNQIDGFEKFTPGASGPSEAAPSSAKPAAPAKASTAADDEDDIPF